ncbi:MAG: Copper binding protein plastocyanin/azurin family [Solirubrobacterales bacterium]|nr:Copper binding protein plastocyanin/azurin family [Solirubrobacterales bacterium]
MRRRGGRWGLAAVVACAAALALALPAATSASDASPTRLLATGFEFDVRVSTGTVNPGRAIVQFRNTGEDPHDLTIQRSDAGAPLASTGEVQPGGLVKIDTRLRKASHFYFYCSLLDHRQLGMEALVKVRRHRR